MASKLEEVIGARGPRSVSHMIQPEFLELSVPQGIAKPWWRPAETLEKCSTLLNEELFQIQKMLGISTHPLLSLDRGTVFAFIIFSALSERASK